MLMMALIIKCVSGVSEKETKHYLTQRNARIRTVHDQGYSKTEPNHVPVTIASSPEGHLKS